jgi:hypothetical protein
VTMAGNTPISGSFRPAGRRSPSAAAVCGDDDGFRVVSWPSPPGFSGSGALSGV